MNNHRPKCIIVDDIKESFRSKQKLEIYQVMLGDTPLTNKERDKEMYNPVTVTKKVYQLDSNPLIIAHVETRTRVRKDFNHVNQEPVITTSTEVESTFEIKGPGISHKGVFGNDTIKLELAYSDESAPVYIKIENLAILQDLASGYLEYWNEIASVTI